MPLHHLTEPSMSTIVSSTFSRRFRRVAAGLAASLTLGALPAHAALSAPFPADFRSSQVVNVDAAISNPRRRATGLAVVLIHGFGETGDMWSPMAAELAKDHTVVVPDLRGMGLSSHPAGGYDKWTQAGDMRAVLDKLGIDHADIVAHDIGTMVAYAYAARYPDKTTRLVVIDSPIPGIPPWNQIVRLPALWHFNCGGRDAERLVAGRERIYLDRFWNEFAGDPSKIDEATRRHYAAIYARPGAMHSAFAQFLAIAQKDEADNLKAMQTKLTMPVLAIGAEKAFGANVAIVMRNAATNVQEVVVPNAGHWLMEEAPAATITAVRGFLAAHWSPAARLVFQATRLQRVHHAEHVRRSGRKAPRRCSAFYNHFDSKDAEHRDTPSAGCLITALGAEIGREPAAKPAFTEHVRAVLKSLTSPFRRAESRDARGDAIRLLSSIVGAVVIARAVDDVELSNEILLEARKSLK